MEKILKKTIFVCLVSAAILVGISVIIQSNIRSHSDHHASVMLEGMLGEARETFENWSLSALEEAKTWAGMAEIREIGAENISFHEKNETAASLNAWRDLGALIFSSNRDPRPVAISIHTVDGAFVSGFPEERDVPIDAIVGRLAQVVDEGSAMWLGIGAKSEDGDGQEHRSSAFVTVPLLQAHDDLIGFLVFEFDASATVSAISQLGRVGASGENYLFDRRGTILSPSRFDEQLREAGLLEPGQASAGNIQMREPSADQLAGEAPNLDRASLPLTQLAQRVLADGKGKLLEEYSDYRGVPVVGAGAWLDRLQVGISSEIDADEAFSHRDTALLAISGFTWLSVFLIAIGGAVFHGAARKLHTNDNRFRSALDVIPDGFALYDAQDRLVLCNERYREFYPDSAEAMVEGRTFERILRFGLEHGQYPEARGREEEWLAERLENHQNPVKPIEQLMKDGRWLRVFESRMPDGGTVGLRVDITELKKTQISLAERNDNLAKILEVLQETRDQVVHQEKLAALGRMAAGAAHELNNPLMGIAGYLDFLAKKVADEKLQSIIAKAQNSFERVSKIASSMMAYGRPSDNVRAAFDLAPCLEDVVDLVQSELRTGDIAIECDIPADLPTVWGDPQEIQQVVLNLMLNAKDAMEASPEKKIELAVHATEGTVVLSVADTGTGIQDGVKDKVFDPFFTTKPLGKGTGMGLAVASQILGDVGGSLELVNREDRTGVRALMRLNAVT